MQLRLAYSCFELLNEWLIVAFTRMYFIMHAWADLMCNALMVNLSVLGAWWAMRHGGGGGGGGRGEGL